MDTGLVGEYEVVALKLEPEDTELQFVTFYVADIFLGIDIRQIREINRQLEPIRVPHSPDHILGVINLRGEVTTIADLRRILGLLPGELSREARNLIVNSQGESIGLQVDRVCDTLTIHSDQIRPVPGNVDRVAGRFLTGVHTTDSELLVILNVEAALGDQV